MKRLFYIIVIIAVAFPAWSQVDDSDQAAVLNSLNPPAMVYSGPDGVGDGVVGAIPATVDVSALGGAVYSIPIQVPGGINGMQPELSVVYNSQSGNGLLGWGWNLGGVSSVTRVGKSLYFDGMVNGVNLDKHDRFALDGQRLVVLDNSGYHANGAQFKTELDGMSKIVSYAEDTVTGPKRFKVWTVDGLILEYGLTPNSRLTFAEGNDSIVGMWLIAKVTDRNGNSMVYHYLNDGESVAIDKIRYTLRDTLQGCYSVVFDYEIRNDVEMSFLGNHAVKQKHLLSRVRVKWWEEEMWRYEFNYEQGTGPNGPDYYKRLSNVAFSCGNVHYNSTRIVWGERPDEIQNSYLPYSNIQDVYLTHVNYLSPGILQNNVKFSGDFNGDGLSDLIVVERGITVSEVADEQRAGTDSLGTRTGFVVRKMRVYLNEGNSREDYNPGTINMSCAQLLLDNVISYYYELIDAIWVYVCDFNGDGLDDIVVLEGHENFSDPSRLMKVEAFKSVILADGTWSIERVRFDNANNPVWYKSILASQNMTLLTGDFCGRGRDDLILAYNSDDSERFVYFTYHAGTGRIFSSVGASDWKGEFYHTCDYDGDGRTEVWYAAGGQSGKLVKLYLNQDGQYTYSLIKNCFDSSCRLFMGDFNGDGKSDFLAYHSEMQDHAWEVVLGGADNTNGTYDVSSIMYNCTDQQDPGDYSFDFDAWERGVSIHFYVGAVDVDGDGKSDVVIKNDNNLYFLYGPLRKESGVSLFAHSWCETTQSIGFNGEYSYGLCVGNFLGQENVSILQNSLLLSQPPHSDYYSVDSITDGMGNRASFEYGYLVRNPLGQNNIFTVTHNGQDLGHSVYCRPLPIRALKKATSQNLHSGAPVSVLTYSYENALVHKFGRGFLGFAEIRTTSLLAGVEQSRTIREFSTSEMEDHPFAVLKHEMIYGPLGILSSESNYTYYEYQCSRSPQGKVFFPALDSKTVDSYGVASVDFFSRTIEKASYTTYARNTESFSYTDVVSPLTTLVGVHPFSDVTSVTSCKFQTSTVIQYKTPDASAWVMRRPRSVQTTRKQLGGNDADVKSLEVYEYGLSNPFLVSRRSDYPAADTCNTAGLATCVLYVYDAAGNVTGTTLRALNGTVADRTTEYEYEQFRTRKLERNALGYETRTFYSYYWELRTATDCNGLETLYWGDDHLGSTDYVRHPDGTHSCSAKRWAFDAMGARVAHAPDSAAYYIWERSTDEAPSMVFYDAAGRELRAVTEDMDGRVVYHDTDYDGFGRVKKEWEPYYGDSQRQYGIKYVYDENHRIDTVYYPDSTYMKSFYYSAAGLSAVTTDLHDRVGGVRRSVRKTNALGWTTESVDNSGSTVYYNHYPNGKLKKAGVDPTVEVMLQYDDAGNRTDVTDPDYGHQHSIYNAFGELVSITTPKGDVTEYSTDALGRVVKRYDRDNTNHTVDSTIWVYGSASGEKGLLKSVDFDNGKQMLTYQYDALCRPVTVGDSRMGGRPYQTCYVYDSGTGRVSQITYPSGYVVGREYRNGHLWKIKDAQDNLLWQTLRENAYGQIVSYKTGNLVMDSLAYDDRNHLLLGQYARKGSTIIQDFTYTYDGFCNLASRTEGKYGTPMTETFKYDNLDRLDTVLFNNTVSCMVYDTYGRMTRRTSQGTVVFKDASYDDQGKPHAVLGAAVNNVALPDALSFFYTMHDKVKCIERGDDVLTIDYGYDRQRIGMTEWIEASHSTTSKLYVGNCEFNKEVNRRRHLTYLTGPLGVFAVYEELGPLYKGGGADGGESDDDDGGGDEDNFIGSVYYLHRDHLGSITTVTNSSGVIVQELSYDAWGNLRNPTTWSGSFTGTPKFDRGYTGHEHLANYKLINMNGRMYDPLMCCFLSVDSYVQDPGNAQNFNRYAYCLNNPLKYTDPDGEWVQLVVAGLIGGTVNWLANGAELSWKGLAYFGIGAAAGVLGAAAGGAVAGAMELGGFVSGLASGAVGGASSGLITGSGNAWMQGASFGQGLKAGVISAGIGAGTGALLGGLTQGYMDYSKGYSFWDGSAIDEFVIGNVVLDPVPNNYNSSAQAEINDQLLSDRLFDEFGVKEGDFGINKITTKTSTGYIITSDGRYINVEKGYEVGGYTRSFSKGISEVHISPKTTTSSMVDFRAVAGHELIHAYHNNTILSVNSIYSERVAYKFTHDVYVKNHQYLNAIKVLENPYYSSTLIYWGEVPPYYLSHPFIP